jgi:hypothetical protein
MERKKVIVFLRERKQGQINPTASVAVLYVALPELSVPVPSVVVPSLKVTVPVAADCSLAKSAKDEVRLLVTDLALNSTLVARRKGRYSSIERLYGYPHANAFSP